MSVANITDPLSVITQYTGFIMSKKHKWKHINGYVGASALNYCGQILLTGTFSKSVNCTETDDMPWSPQAMYVHND